MRTAISPDGRYTLEFHSFEMRMSHWVDTVLVMDNTTSHIVLDLRDSLWSAGGEEWLEQGRMLRLFLRRYPGNWPAVKLTLNFNSNLAEIETDGTFVELPFVEVYAWLEKYAAEI